MDIGVILVIIFILIIAYFKFKPSKPNLPVNPDAIDSNPNWVDDVQLDSDGKINNDGKTKL